MTCADLEMACDELCKRLSLSGCIPKGNGDLLVYVNGYRIPKEDLPPVAKKIKLDEAEAICGIQVNGRAAQQLYEPKEDITQVKLQVAFFRWIEIMERVATGPQVTVRKAMFAGDCGYMYIVVYTKSAS